MKVYYRLLAPLISDSGQYQPDIPGSAANPE